MRYPPRSLIETKTVEGAYGLEHVLHISRLTSGTVHKHAAETREFCPYCNVELDYGMGIHVPAPEVEPPEAEEPEAGVEGSA